MTNLVTRTFRKEEKLCSQKVMGDLFLSGDSFLSYPFRVVWKIYEVLPSESLAQAGFSVPKRIFKHAADRNRLKRMMRESYRLNKSTLYESLRQSDSRIALMLVYVAKEELPYVKIDQAIVKALGKIMGQFNDHQEENE